MSLPLSGVRSLLVVVAAVTVGWSTSAAWPAGQTAAPAARPATALPTADVIFERYRNAIGGEAAIRRHTHRTIRGQFEIAAQGMTGELVVLAAAPDLMTLTVTLAGIGEMRRGYDGKVGWSIDPAVGPRLLEGRELAELRHSADFYEDLHDGANYQSATVVGRTPFEGRECYEVRLVRHSGIELTEFFDVETGLLAGVAMDASSQMGTVPATTVVTGYKRFGGILTPTVTRQRMMGLESTTTISSITFEPIPREAFDLPAPIAALAARTP